MRRAGRIVAEVLALIESELKPGVTTGHLDRLAEQHIRTAGAIPSFKGYLGGGRYGKGPHAFPASTCISIDAEVVHGIPGDRTIRDGSVVSVDVGAILDGWHGDGARTFLVGDVAAAARALVDATRLAIMAGHRGGPARRPGRGHLRRVEDVGIAARLRDRQAVRRARHRDEDARGPPGPQLPHRPARRRAPAGLCLAIEPMFTLGSGDV